MIEHLPQGIGDVKAASGTTPKESLCGCDLIACDSTRQAQMIHVAVQFQGLEQIGFSVRWSYLRNT